MTENSLQDEFEKKYCLWGDMLYKIAFLYLANSHDAEDVLQEVFIKLLYSSPKFKSTEHEKAWLIRITQNKCKDLLRRSSRNEVNIDDYSITAADCSTDVKIDVVKKIIDLPEKYKLTVILYYYYDYSVEEIGKIAEQKKKNTEGYFYIQWNLSDALYEEFEKAASSVKPYVFDFSTVYDTMEFTVEYKNGDIAKSVVDINFDSDGNMFAKCRSYDYIESDK